MIDVAFFVSWYVIVWFAVSSCVRMVGDWVEMQ